MQGRDISLQADPPDLLRRFVRTPFKAIYRTGNVEILVQTNDITLLPSFPLETNLAASGEQMFEWKLVRDLDTPGQLESPVFLETEVMTIVQMGPACLLALDRERRELLGFIGSEIDRPTHHAFLVPLLHRMTNEAFAALPPADLAHRSVGSIYD
jgi:hypothetical protein